MSTSREYRFIVSFGSHIRVIVPFTFSPKLDMSCFFPSLMPGALDTFARSVAGPLSGYLFNAWGARGVPLSCSCIALYVAFMLTLRGVAPESGSGDPGEGMGEGLGKADAVPSDVKNK